MFQINLKGAEPQWYSWPPEKPKDEQAQLLIRPYPSSRNELIARGRREGSNEDLLLEIVKSGKENKDIFIYCLLDAKGLCDQKGTDLKLEKKITIKTGTEEKVMTIKEYIYEYQSESGLPSFVLLKAKAIIDEVKEEEKNLRNG